MKIQRLPAPDSRAPSDPGTLLPEENTPGLPGGVTRRHAIRRLMELLAGVAAVSGLPAPGGGAEGHKHSASSNAPAMAVESSAADFFSPEQRATVSAMADLIIPPDAVSPGAKAAGVASYIEFLAANASPDTQKAWLRGLQELDAFSRERTGQVFAALDPARQENLIAELAGYESSPQTPAQEFFVRVKHATAEGFYTSKVGLLDDLKYQGNTYVDGPATCQDQFADSAEASCPAPGGESKAAAAAHAPRDLKPQEESQ